MWILLDYYLDTLSLVYINLHWTKCFPSNIYSGEPHLNTCGYDASTRHVTSRHVTPRANLLNVKIQTVLSCVFQPSRSLFLYKPYPQHHGFVQTLSIVTWNFYTNSTYKNIENLEKKKCSILGIEKSGITSERDHPRRFRRHQRDQREKVACTFLFRNVR